MTDDAQREAATWHRRHEKLIDELNGHIVWYKTHAETNRAFHIALSVIVLFLAVIAPLTIVSASGAIGTTTSGGNTLAAFGLSSSSMAQISLVLTIVLGVTEGLRRFFRFEHKWHSFYTSWLTLRHLREAYKDAQARVTGGTEQWWNNYASARTAMQSRVENETQGYFAAMFAATNPPLPAANVPAAIAPRDGP
jgi:hypothetical protein